MITGLCYGGESFIMDEVDTGRRSKDCIREGQELYAVITSPIDRHYVLEVNSESAGERGSRLPGNTAGRRICCLVMTQAIALRRRQSTVRCSPGLVVSMKNGQLARFKTWP